MRELVTIVIPSHKRAALLGRALAHYAPSGLPLLVADSSPEPLPPRPDLPQLTYLHLPGLGFEAKLALVAERIATPYAVLCADDDFTSVSSIARCVDFLQAHPNHAGAHGHYLRVLRQGRELLVEPCYLGTREARMHSLDPCERLVELNRPYVPLFYAVLRAEVLRLAFGPGSAEETFYASSELALGMAAAICGKVSVLPTLHTVRDIVPSVDLAGAPNDDLGVVSRSPAYARVYGLFVERLAGELARRAGLALPPAREAILASVRGFVECCCSHAPRRPFYKKLPKYARRLGYALVPGLGARARARAEAQRQEALAAYLAPAGRRAWAELEAILAVLGAWPEAGA